MINVTYEPSGTHKKIPQRGNLGDITEKLMEKIQDTVNQRVENALKKFKDITNKKFEKPWKQLNELREDFNKQQSITKEIIKKRYTK
jgi:cell division protein FtsX